MNNTSARATPPKTRSWPIRAIVLLLMVQAIGLGYISLNILVQQPWSIFAGQINLALTSLNFAQMEALETALLLLAPALLAAVAASPFFFLRPSGWLLAMMAQGLTLWACLTLYFRDKPFLIYPVMIYGILMVLYLNSYTVRLVFHSPAKPAKVEDVYES